MKNEFVELLLQSEGIVGALSGTIVGFILSEATKRIGRIKIYINKAERIYVVEEDDDEGFKSNKTERTKIEESFDKEGIQWSDADINLDIINTMQENKTLRNVHIQCVFDGGETIKLPTKIRPTEKTSENEAPSYAETTILNLPPKEISSYDLLINLPDKYKAHKIAKIYFVGTKLNGRCFKKRIKEKK